MTAEDQAGALYTTILDVLRRRFGDRIGAYAFPPPVFVAMQGEFLELDLDTGVLVARFPVLQTYLNPYGAMQGGMVAAAVDNTLGPLSVLVAPPNVTRHLEMKYSHPVPLSSGHVVVTARLLNRKERWLTFAAEARSPEGLRYARAKAVHYIIEE